MSDKLEWNIRFEDDPNEQETEENLGADKFWKTVMRCDDRILSIDRTGLSD